MKMTALFSFLTPQTMCVHKVIIGTPKGFSLNVTPQCSHLWVTKKAVNTQLATPPHKTSLESTQTRINKICTLFANGNKNSILPKPR